jgi:hypothetical protein
VIGFAFNHPDGSRTGVKFTTTADRHPDGGPTATVAVIGRFGPNDRLLSESPLFQFGIGAADFEIRFGADRIELTVVAAASRNAGEIPERQTTSLAGPVPAPTEAVLICPEGDYYLLNLDPQFPRPVFDPAPETSRR